MTKEVSPTPVRDIEKLRVQHLPSWAMPHKVSKFIKLWRIWAMESSQAEMADKIDMLAKSISDLEIEKHSPSTEQFEELAKLMNPREKESLFLIAIQDEGCFPSWFAEVFKRINVTKIDQLGVEYFLTEQPPESIGGFLRHWRKQELELTLDSLGNKVELCGKSIGNLERDEYSPSKEQMEKIGAQMNLREKTVFFLLALQDEDCTPSWFEESIQRLIG